MPRVWAPLLLLASGLRVCIAVVVANSTSNSISSSSSSNSRSSTTSRPIVEVPGLGLLRGALLGERVAVFRGVPYAKPPFKELRWRPPQPHGPWTATADPEEPREAGDYRHACIPLDGPSDTHTSEDCLFLNIATPVDALVSRGRLPVLVYIHGGSYESGASNHNSPESLAFQSPEPLVVVTLNYRLNLFGFLGSHALQGRSGDGSAGNYGIQDQRLALRWVATHIGAFGGAAADVTIFGESAGGNSVLVHLTQPASFDLYSRAIVDSGTYTTGKPLEDAETLFQDVMRRISCGDLECLENSDPQELAEIAAMFRNSWGPVIDGVAFTGLPQELISSGRYNNRVPVLLGSNRDEAANWVMPINLTEAELDSYLQETLLPSQAAAVKEVFDPSEYAYPSLQGNFSRWWWEYMRIVTDSESNMRTGLSRMSLGHCPTRCMARALLRGGTPQVFTYLFAQTSQQVSIDVNEGLPTGSTGPGSVVVPHATELPFVFGLVGRMSVDTSAADLSRNMSAYWATFAASGDPNRRGLPPWPPYDDKDTTMLLAAGAMSPLTKYHISQCDLFDRLVGEVCTPSVPHSRSIWM